MVLKLPPHSQALECDSLPAKPGIVMKSLKLANTKQYTIILLKSQEFLQSFCYHYSRNGNIVMQMKEATE